MKRLPQHWAWARDEQRLGRAIQKRKCWSCRSRKTTRVWSVSAENWIGAWEVLADESCSRGAEQARLQKFLSDQWSTWASGLPKSRPETGLLQVREKVGGDRRSKPGDPAAIDGGSALSGKHARAAKRATSDVARFTQRLDAAQRRVTDLGAIGRAGGGDGEQS